MSVETNERREFERYLEYQRMRRGQRIETLGSAATTLFLATIDLGVIGASEPSSERGAPEHVESTPEIDVADVRITRQRRLAEFATESAELGYSRAA